MAAKYADRVDDTLYPSRKTLMADATTSESSLDRSLKELQQVGALTIRAQWGVQGDRTSNLYRLHFVNPGGVTHAATGGVTDAPTGGTKSEVVTIINRNQSQEEPDPTVFDSDESQTVGGETTVSRTPRTKQPKKITVVDEPFRARMRERFSAAFGQTVDERIEEAMAHKASRNWDDKQLYVQGWLRRDAEKLAAPSVNGHQPFRGRATRVEVSKDRNFPAEF